MHRERLQHLRDFLTTLPDSVITQPLLLATRYDKLREHGLYSYNGAATYLSHQGEFATALFFDLTPNEVRALFGPRPMKTSELIGRLDVLISRVTVTFTLRDIDFAPGADHLKSWGKIAPLLKNHLTDVGQRTLETYAEEDWDV